MYHVVGAALVFKSPHKQINSHRDLGPYWKVGAQITDEPLFGAEIAQGLNDCSNTQTQIDAFVFFMNRGKGRQYTAEITSEMKYYMKWQQSS